MYGDTASTERKKEREMIVRCVSWEERRHGSEGVYTCDVVVSHVVSTEWGMSGMEA